MQIDTHENFVRPKKLNKPQKSMTQFVYPQTFLKTLPHPNMSDPSMTTKQFGPKKCFTHKKFNPQKF